jgi:Coenzyme PQQ synthesis protein D (PqqD)
MPSLADDTYLRRKEQVIAQENSGTLVLFNMDDGQYYSLNEIGSRIWELCDGSRSVGQVVSILCEEYDSPAEIVNRDALELLEELAVADLLMVGPPLPSADPGD